MNDRIKVLLNVCGMPNEQLMEIYNNPNQTFYMEQFAELIIRECIVISDNSDVFGSKLIGQRIKSRFGV
jgi:hypothetical protein